MQSTRSAPSAAATASSTGVSGLNATPTPSPSERASAIARGGVVARLDVERHAVATGLRDRLEVALGLAHHQMAVEPRSQPRTNGEIDASTTGPIVISGMK